MDPLLKTATRTYRNLYQPSINLKRKQIGMIPGELKPQRLALDQAKKNYFRDVGVQAEDRGLFYSGYQPLEQGKYLGETYLPGMAQIEQAGLQKKFSLLDELNALLIGRGKDTLSQYQTAAGRRSQDRIARDDIRAMLEAARI